MPRRFPIRFPFALAVDFAVRRRRALFNELFRPACAASVFESVPTSIAKYRSDTETSTLIIDESNE